MRNPREILVATDLSEESFAGIAFARDLAESMGARIALVHVVDVVASLRDRWSQSPDFFERFPIERLATEALALAKARLAEVADRFGVVETIVTEGDPPARLLLRLATARGSDLLVLATRSRSGEGAGIVGGTTEKVLRRAPCPVLTVPRPARREAVPA
jgi:nucleotide-binding universal stress UspA family protein